MRASLPALLNIGSACAAPCSATVLPLRFASNDLTAQPAYRGFFGLAQLSMPHHLLKVIR